MLRIEIFFLFIVTANKLLEKKILLNYELSERNFLLSLLTEVVTYAANHDFGAKKLACLLSLYVSAHSYFKWYYWLPPSQIWCYFKEILIRHTVEVSKHLFRYTDLTKTFIHPVCLHFTFDLFF